MKHSRYWNVKFFPSGVCLVVSPQTEDGTHQTAVHLLVRYMALSAVHILVSHGADVNAVDSNGMTPLHMAAGSLHKDMIACLIKEGADINVVCTVFFFLF